MPYVEVWVDDPKPTKEQADAIHDLVTLALECAMRWEDRVLECAARRVQRMLADGYTDGTPPTLPIDAAYKKWRESRDAAE